MSTCGNRRVSPSSFRIRPSPSTRGVIAGCSRRASWCSPRRGGRPFSSRPVSRPIAPTRRSWGRASDSTKSRRRSPTASWPICSSSSASSSLRRQVGHEPRADPAPGGGRGRSGGLRLLQRDVERRAAREGSAPGGAAGQLLRRAILLGARRDEGRVRRRTASAEWYARSAAPAAAPARARVLLAAGRAPEAVALLDTLARRRVREGDWGPLLDEVAHWAGPDTASRTLDELLAQEGRRLPTGARGRLLLADGDRLFTAGRAPAAGARYAQVVALMPDSLEGLEARVRALRMLATQADSVADLVAVRARLGTLVQSGATADARALDALIPP